jgi:hypothetical protein
MKVAEVVKAAETVKVAKVAIAASEEMAVEGVQESVRGKGVDIQYSLPLCVSAAPQQLSTLVHFAGTEAVMAQRLLVAKAAVVVMICMHERGDGVCALAVVFVKGA